MSHSSMLIERVKRIIVRVDLVRFLLSMRRKRHFQLPVENIT